MKAPTFAKGAFELFTVSARGNTGAVMASPRHPVAAVALSNNLPTQPTTGSVKDLPVMFSRQAGLYVAVVAVLLLLPVLLLVAVDQGMLDGAIQRFASDRSGRQVHFGHLAAHLLSVDPTVSIDSLSVGSPPDITTEPVLQARSVTAHLKLLPLLVGRFEPSDLSVEGLVLQLVRKGPLKVNYDFGGKLAERLRAIHRLNIRDGHVRLDDTKRVTMIADFSHDAAAANKLAFHLVGAGKNVGVPYQVETWAGPLVGYRKGAPYPVQAVIKDGDTVVRLQGTASEPLQIRQFDIKANATGPNLADLGYMFGLSAPNTGPYKATADVHRDGAVTRFTNIESQIGQSDFSGSSTSDRAGARPFFHIILHSRVFHLVDARAMLAPLPSHAAARSQSGAPPTTPRTDHTFASSRPFQVERLKASDFDLSYSADRLIALSEPVSRLTAHLTLRDGRLSASPVVFLLPPGRGQLSFGLDVSRGIPTLHLAGTLADVRMGAVQKDLTKTIDGSVDARISASGSGHSMEEVVRNANGRLALSVRDGVMTKAKAAALSGDLAQAISLSLGAEAAKTEVNCAVADMTIERGALHAADVMAVTGSGHTSGTGTIDMSAKTISFEFQGQPIRHRMFELNVPIVVSGPLNHPKVSVRTTEAVKKNGLGGVLALIASPIASHLPTVGEPIPQPDCKAELARSAAFVRP